MSRTRRRITGRAWYAHAADRRYRLECIVDGMTDERAGERKLYRADMARLAGVELQSFTERDMKPPPRDGTDIEGGKARPWWWESTARAWLDARPGKGWRRGMSTQRDASEA